MVEIDSLVNHGDYHRRISRRVMVPYRLHVDIELASAGNEVGLLGEVLVVESVHPDTAFRFRAHDSLHRSKSEHCAGYRSVAPVLDAVPLVQTLAAGTLFVDAAVAEDPLHGDDIVFVHRLVQLHRTCNHFTLEEIRLDRLHRFLGEADYHRPGSHRMVDRHFSRHAARLPSRITGRKGIGAQFLLGTGECQRRERDKC